MVDMVYYIRIIIMSGLIQTSYLDDEPYSRKGARQNFTYNRDFKYGLREIRS